MSAVAPHDWRTAPGVGVDPEALFKLRHVVRPRDAIGLAPTGRSGGFAGKRRGNGLEVVDVRPFSEGDDIRHVDAATTARTGRTHVKTFRDERDRAVLLVADFRPSMLWGTRRRLRSVAAAEALAIAGWRAIGAGGRVGLVAITAGEPLHVAPRARNRGMAAVAGALSRAHGRALALAAAGDLADPPLAPALERAVALASPGTTVVLATGLDTPGEDFDRLALALRRRVNLVVLLVRDAFETTPPRGAYPFVPGPNPASHPGAAAAAALVRWAFVTRREADASKDDPRPARLARLGAKVHTIDAASDAEAMAAALEGIDADRS